MFAVTVVVHTSDLSTTIMAALGLGLALLSLAWQALSFGLAGSRVRVRIRSGTRGPLGDMSFPGEIAPEQDRGLRAHWPTGRGGSTCATSGRTASGGPRRRIGMAGTVGGACQQPIAGPADPQRPLASAGDRGTMLEPFVEDLRYFAPGDIDPSTGPARRPR